MKKLFSACLLFLTVLLAAPRAPGWNHKGHMAVAYIAYRELATGEREKVFLLLKRHPDFAQLSRAAGGPERGDYQLWLFIEAARWPDRIKSDPRFYDEGLFANPTRSLPGFPDMEKHSSWHYKYSGFRDDGREVALDGRSANVQSRIVYFRRKLANSGVSEPHKAYFLSWLEHLVGDAHQPLHCATRVTPDFKLGDAGGLHFKIAPVSLPGDREAATDLHTLWDGLLGADATAPAVIRLAEEAEATFPEENAEDTNEAEWVAESFEYAKMAAYAPLIKMTGTPRVSQSYLDEARNVSLRRVKLAGHRLALVIRQSLASYTPATPERPDSSRVGAAPKSSAEGDPPPAAVATSGVFTRPVGLTAGEVAPLKGSAESVTKRKEALRAELAKLERVGAAAAMKKSLLDSLGGARLEVVKLHSRFERAGVEYKQAARLFFGGITARYDHEMAAVKQSRPRDFAAARDRAFLTLDFNHSAYETAAKKRSLTFDLEVSSKPEGVTISYKRSGDPAYTSDGSQTEVTLNNLVLAQWYVRAELKGYKPQEKVFDPFREQKYVLKFEMEAEPPPPPPPPPKATKGRGKGKGKGGGSRRPPRRGR